MPACLAGDRGSIPLRGASFRCTLVVQRIRIRRYERHDGSSILSKGANVRVVQRFRTVDR